MQTRDREREEDRLNLQGGYDPDRCLVKTLTPRREREVPGRSMVHREKPECRSFLFKLSFLSILWLIAVKLHRGRWLYNIIITTDIQLYAQAAEMELIVVFGQKPEILYVDMLMQFIL